MNHARRRFLLKLAGGTVATGILAAVAGKWVYAPFRSRLYQLATDVPPGPIDAGTERTLLAIVDTLIGAPFETGHYQNFFGWHATRRPGYRGLYERSATLLDRMAATAGTRGFADLEFEDRRKLIDELLAFRRSKVRRVWSMVAARDAVLFDRHLVQPALRLYSGTDAWVHLGYNGWRGRPRGLESYTKAPGGAAWKSM